MGIQCFLLEPTERVSQKLRRYSSRSTWDDAQARAIYPNGGCPLTGGSYHNAEVRIEDADVIPGDREGSVANGARGDEPPRDDPRWPTVCACGYAFDADGDPHQLFCERIYRRADTGAEMTLRDAPSGAMWFAPWMGQHWHPQLGEVVSVKLPDGTDWLPDMQAQNCTMPDDHGQERHHCWVMHGQPPNLTIDKQGVTCAAGGGSIQSRAYHGFLTGGVLT